MVEESLAALCGGVGRVDGLFGDGVRMFTKQGRRPDFWLYDRCPARAAQVVVREHWRREAGYIERLEWKNSSRSRENPITLMGTSFVRTLGG